MTLKMPCFLFEHVTSLRYQLDFHISLSSITFPQANMYSIVLGAQRDSAKSILPVIPSKQSVGMPAQSQNLSSIEITQSFLRTLNICFITIVTHWILIWIFWLTCWFTSLYPMLTGSHQNVFFWLLGFFSIHIVRCGICFSLASSIM